MRRLLPAAVVIAIAAAIGAIPAGADAGINGVTLRTTLTGAEEIPGPGDDDGSGNAAILVFPHRATVCFHIEVSDIEPATLAHVHEGVEGVAGGVVVTLVPPTDGESRGCVMDLDPALVRDIGLNPTGYYVNVHNEPFPSGALRGQLGD
jgi:hypothetical protein